MTFQMLYSAIPPVATFARLAMLPPGDATWVQVRADEVLRGQNQAHACGKLIPSS
jgi:hypothetical protein